MPLTCGVPQESILKPDYYISFKIKVPFWPPDTKIQLFFYHCYADDANLNLIILSVIIFVNLFSPLKRHKFAVFYFSIYKL